jgi:crotonobetaine/carnitine-CoA ligase
MEATFLTHPDLDEAAVHAVPSPVGEDDIKVTAVLRATSSLTEAELCRWAIARVPYFAVPRFIEFRRELPRNLQGRVLKYQLREEGLTPSTWDLDESDIEIVRR